MATLLFVRQFFMFTQADIKDSEVYWPFMCGVHRWQVDSLNEWPVTRKVMMTSSQGSIFPRHWSFVRGLHRPPVNSLHRGQWRGALVFSLICAWTKVWVNNGDAGDFRRHRAHYDVTGMYSMSWRHPVSVDCCTELTCCSPGRTDVTVTDYFILLVTHICIQPVEKRGQKKHLNCTNE